MADITFTRADFSQFARLAALLEAQRLTVAIEDMESFKGTEACHTLVRVLAASEATPETATLDTQARKFGAKRIIALKPAAAAWTIKEELGGRLIEVGLPADTATAHDPAIMMLTTRLAEPFGRMIAADPATGSLIDLARRVAKHDVSVFINGPTGSGKEVLSRMIHHASPRADGPFIALNCAAIPENMLEAMLFGHEKGAFTGASAPNKGHFSTADGGTLLLDEISEMPVALQAKMLRVLQEKVVTPVGTQKEVPVDIRVLATSNVDMEAAIADGRFREDLFFRLIVFPLETLALSEHPLDIPILGQALLARHAATGRVPQLREDASALLLEHDWPGNVRELENVMQRAIVLADGGDISREHILLKTAGSVSVRLQSSGPKAGPCARTSQAA